MDLVEALVRVAFGAPLATAALLWFAAARWARRNVRGGWSILGPIAVLTFLYKERRNLRGAVLAVSTVLAVVAWLWLVTAVPAVRWALTIAIPSAAFFGGLWWSAATYPALDPLTALRYHVAVGRHRQVLTDAAHASAGEGARVESVEVVGGNVEAVIVGPAGHSHDDLVEALRGSLAESVMAQTGRAMQSISIVSTGAKGRVRVRCQSADPYEQTVRLSDLRET